MSEPKQPEGDDGDRKAGRQHRTTWQHQVAEVLRDANLPTPGPDDPVEDLPPEPTYRELLAMYEVELCEDNLHILIDDRIEYEIKNLRLRTVFGHQETSESPELALSALRSVQNLQRLIRNEQIALRQHGRMHDPNEGPDAEEASRKLGEMHDQLDILDARIRRLNPAAAREFDAEAEA